MRKKKSKPEDLRNMAWLIYREDPVRSDTPGHRSVRYVQGHWPLPCQLTHEIPTTHASASDVAGPGYDAYPSLLLVPIANDRWRVCKDFHTLDKSVLIHRMEVAKKASHLMELGKYLCRKTRSTWIMSK